MMGEPDDFASDLYFASVDPNTTWNKDSDTEFAEEGELDDAVPDMANGRLAINSPSVLRSVLNGLIAREKNPIWPENYQKNVLSLSLKWFRHAVKVLKSQFQERVS